MLSLETVSVLVFLNMSELRTLTRIGMWCQTGPEHLLFSQSGMRPLPAIDEQPRTVRVCLPQKASCFNKFTPVKNTNYYCILTETVPT